MYSFPSFLRDFSDQQLCTVHRRHLRFREVAVHAGVDAVPLHSGLVEDRAVDNRRSVLLTEEGIILALLILCRVHGKQTDGLVHLGHTALIVRLNRICYNN